MTTKLKLELPRELEIKTADLWLSTGAIKITSIGEENTYYSNEFGHLFFCKNYPVKAAPYACTCDAECNGLVPNYCSEHDGDYSAFLAFNNCD